MTPSSFKERLANLEQIQGISPVRSGSPEDLRLSPLGSISQMRALDAIAALVRRGVGVHLAKTAVDHLAEATADQTYGPVDVHAPRVEDRDALIHELAKAGVAVKFLVLAA
jgi:hypothetical protein